MARSNTKHLNSKDLKDLPNEPGFYPIYYYIKYTNTEHIGVARITAETLEGDGFEILWENPGNTNPNYLPSFAKNLEWGTKLEFPRGGF